MALLGVEDRVTVLGIPGVHLITELLLNRLSHPEYVIRLAPGTNYGARRGGELMAVECWRCQLVPGCVELVH